MKHQTLDTRLQALLQHATLRICSMIGLKSGTLCLLFCLMSLSSCVRVIHTPAYYPPAAHLHAFEREGEFHARGSDNANDALKAE
jgi:hypothetical protein